jgi:DNA-dependent protein kinase catalytic subunit
VFNVKLECNDKFSPIIYLDHIIERVKNLALSSSDRSVRITACELLHGLVLYFMGKNLERYETIPMWRQLCCDLIILGADEDLTVRQLYEPLLMQMMHYFSQPSKIMSSLSKALIEALMEMISHKNNCVQDLSARLLREFNVWLFRQTDRNQRENSPVRLLDLFQELKKMSIETNP